MKRLLALLLALLLVFSLAACDSSLEKEDDDDKKTNQSNKEDKTDKNDEEDSSFIPGNDSAFTEVSVEETVLVDEAGVKITVTGMETDGFFGPELKLLIENNSGMDLDFMAGNVVVNNCMSDGMLYETVKNGKKANAAISFFDTSLESYGIDTIATIEMNFLISEPENYTENYLETEMLTVKTSAADSFDGSYDDSGDVLYDDNDVRIICREYYVDEIFGPQVVFLIENNSGNNIFISSSDMSVNGYMVDGSLYSEVLAGRHAFAKTTFLESSLEDNGITEFEEMELSVRIYDNDTYETIDTVDSIEVNF